MARHTITIAVLVALSACTERPRPWAQLDPDGGAPTLEPAPSAPPPESASSVPSLLGDASVLTDPDLPETPVRVGGPWVRCYGNFRPSGDPRKDVTRLGLLCGPSNGMQRLATKGLEGDVRENEQPVSRTFETLRGECYRIFAVADQGVADLDAVLRSSRGAALATDRGDDGWPILQPDRPICALEDDTWTLDISARRGSGHFAAEVWRLPAP